MQTLQVELAERSYPIYIGTGLFAQAGLFEPHLAGRQVAIITNETVAPLYLQSLLVTLAGLDVTPVILPDGEAFKTWETLQLIFDGLLTARHDRRTTVIALGGGVIGDMAGFAAACYQRGVDFIQVPTTLLSQVDSSVGGKTGINHPLGKNMVGAFYQPKAVIIDISSLNTLPVRELSAGLAEVIKYGLICDEPFLGWLELNMAGLRSLDQALLAEAVARSCAAKAYVVGQDERESGLRATLNLGHTFGHAIETHMGYGAGYVLVEMIMDDETWHLIKHTNKVTGFVGGAKNRPAPISEAEVQEIISRMQEGTDKPRHKVEFLVGESVRVKEGPFTDFNGSVEDVNYEKSKVRVSVTIFGRATPVELDFSQIEKI